MAAPQNPNATPETAVPKTGRRTTSNNPPAAGTATPSNVPQTAGPARPGGPSYEEIQKRAYEIYQQRGGQHGLHDDDWHRAEKELHAARQGAGTMQTTGGTGSKTTTRRSAPKSKTAPSDGTADTAGAPSKKAPSRKKSGEG